MKTTQWAFPTQRAEGMTLRDWFAGQALRGLLIAHPDGGRQDTQMNFARLSYHLADAMMQEREK